jgi:hypothetical protein
MSGLHNLMLQHSVVDDPKTRGMRDSRGRKYLGEVGNYMSHPKRTSTSTVTPERTANLTKSSTLKFLPVCICKCRENISD